MARAPRSYAVVLLAALLSALPVRAAAPGPDRVASEVVQLETLLGEGRFREVAQQAPLVRSHALALPPSAETRQLAIRADVAAGTAAVALQQDAAARQCFERALQLDRQLTLPESTPPKVRRAFDAVKETLR